MGMHKRTKKPGQCAPNKDERANGPTHCCSNVWNTQRVINTGCSMEAGSRSSPMSTPFRMSTPREFLHTETPSHSSSFLRNEGVAALRVHARPSLRSPTHLSPSVREWRITRPTFIWAARAEPRTGARHSVHHTAVGTGSSSAGAARYRPRPWIYPSPSRASCPRLVSRAQYASG